MSKQCFVIIGNMFKALWLDNKTKEPGGSTTVKIKLLPKVKLSLQYTDRDKHIDTLAEGEPSLLVSICFKSKLGVYVLFNCWG